MRVFLSGIAALFASACAHDPIVPIPVSSALETEPMTGIGDRADDPAIWVHASAPEKSVILGTNKMEGLYVYGLDGKERQRLPVGQLNNVDVRANIAVASNDELNALSWFFIDAITGDVAHVADTPTHKLEPYGVCAGIVENKYLGVATYKDGTVQVWEKSTSGGLPTAKLVREIKLASKLEGCVIDDEGNRLFIGEEAHGVWSVDLLTSSSAPVEIDTIAAKNGLVEDVEGMSLWLGEGGAGYLVVSAQEKDRFVIYDRKPPHAPVAVFSIGPNTDGDVDAVTHTDGLDVTSQPLPGFPKGILIVQDDGNPESEVDQNFKIVDWRNVEAVMPSQ